MEIPITATIKKKKNTRRKISNRRLETTENLLEEKQVKKVAKRVRRPRAASNTNKSEFLSKEMLNHEILTKQQENEIGESMAKARKLRTRISKYMIDKNVFESQKQLERVAKPKKKSPKTRNSIYLKDRKRKKGENAFFENEFDLADYELENDFQFEIDFDSMHEIAEVENAKDSNGFHDVNHVDESIFSIHFDPLLKQDIHNLSEHDIVHGLSIPGGKTELIQILSDGINARRKLISCNIKLVTSIARSWMRRAIGSSNASSASAGNTLQLVQIYQVGSWDLPSLDDVVNEGIIGLTKAADKYEAKRGNKFSTYATHWITNYVRECFRDASTGSLRIPSALHQVKADHGKIVKRCYDLGLPPPSEEDIAKEIGVNVKRLRTALRTTQGLVSIDASLYSGMQNTKGSGAGGDGTDSNLVLADTLRCPEPKPDDFVELSILRQCLENAMASELSPHERDIIRLRLGLDDGKTRTVREVVEVCGGAISMAEVRSAERRAFKKLRSPNTMHAHHLMAFLDQTDVMDMHSTQGWRGW